MSNDAAGDATGSDATALTTATLAGGCFWCLEAVFLQLKGVSGAQSGYAGGRRPSPTYEQVCAGSTGHAEVVRVSYDPSVIAFADLLDLFFTIHDPTTLNRQGADSGTQYRSAVFFETAEQEGETRAKIAALTFEQVWGDPIVTEVVPLTQFWPAEKYHDDYFARNPQNPYCAAVIAPKVAKARKQFFEKLAK
ncbi:MAG: peptide-methionine (S)-S-oxide reductase [Gemmatimonadetes bacterium]|nr:MAG: peptide-methionine (S)-S-oxide reductase [Gemmatimonadota bacterium]GDX86494.1 peptide methionine sulfoxide reductase MsrA [Gemmatimonadota bacterium]